MSGNNLPAHFVGIIGATGSGKTTELRRQFARLPAKAKRRVIVWSPKEPIDRYAELFDGVLVRTVSELLDYVKRAGRAGAFRLVFVPTLNQKKDMALFDVICKIALAAGNLCLIAEELHTATTASYAPDGWTKINFMGRAYGVYVFALSQRPASCDKDFWASLSFLHCGRLPYPEDQKAMARTMNIPQAEIAALTGFQAIQRNMQTGETKRLT